MQSVNEILEYLSAATDLVVGKLPGELEFAEKDGVVELTRAFVELRGVKDKLDAIAKDFSKVYEDFKVGRLPAAFELAGVPTVNLDEGYRVTVSHRVFASVKGDRKEQAYQWLKENGFGDLVTQTVNTATLSAAAKAMAEENQELDPDLFNIAIIPTTSVTKTKGSRNG